MHSSILAIEYYLPEKTLTTHDLAAMFPEWSAGAVEAKTGIETRHIVGDDEYASDLALAAAHKIFNLGLCRPSDVDFLVLCTQSPDYLLPTTACILQHKLDISTSAGALDINLGCSGFVYGLGLIEGLVSSGQAKTILFITADAYSRYIRTDDKGLRTIFGDAAAATLIVSHAGNIGCVGPFLYGTDGSGATDLKLPNSGARRSFGTGKCPSMGASDSFMYMDGQRVLDFVRSKVPEGVRALLKKACMTLDDVTLFVFHQANAYILEELRRILQIPKEKFQVAISFCGNTVSSSIPIALRHAEIDGKLAIGDPVMLVGFGVGYSWAATIIRWTGNPGN